MSSEYSEKDLIRIFIEGLNQAASAAKGLAHHQRNSDFLGISAIIGEIATNGARLARAKAMPQMALLNALAKQQEVYAKQESIKDAATKGLVVN